MNKYFSTIIYLLVVSIMLIGCGSSKSGAIQGTIVDVDDEKPIAGVQIILCQVQAEAYEHLICTLQGAPTTVSDSAGVFELAEVPTGTYVLMFGLPGVLNLTPEEWAGMDVTRGTFCMKNGHNSVCEIDGVPPTAFWAEGSVEIGSSVYVFEYQEGEPQPSVVIQAKAEPGSAGEQFHIYQGGLLSSHTGIFANIRGGQYAPTIDVVGNQTASVEVEIPVE